MWSETLASVVTTHPVELSQWWSNFHDPVLDSLIDRAVRNNLELRAAEARVREARAARGVTAAALWPEVDVAPSYS